MISLRVVKTYKHLSWGALLQIIVLGEGLYNEIEVNTIQLRG